MKIKFAVIYEDDKIVFIDDRSNDEDGGYMTVTNGAA